MMRFQLIFRLLIVLFFAQSLEISAQSTDIFQPDFSLGKTDGEINEALIEYWDQYFQENYFDKGYTPEKMKGTGYAPYMRARWFYEMRKDHTGAIPPLQRWQAYLDSKHQLLEKGTALTANWENLGPNTIDTLGGRMISHAFDPEDPEIIWAGSGSGGLWKTTNGGDSWAPASDGIPDLRVSSVAVNPNDRNEIIIGTGIGVNTTLNLRPGVGVLKSSDGGLTWQATNFAFQQAQGVSTYELLWDAALPGRVFLAATNGLWFSDNNGASWIPTALQSQVTDIVINKQDGNILYAAQRGVGIFKSTNSGNSWSLLSNGLPAGTNIHLTSLAICDSFPDVLYCGISTPTSWGLQGFYKTIDSGNSWTRLNNTPWVVCQPGSTTNCQGWFVNICAVSPTDPDLVFFGGVQFWRSADGGNSWTWHDYLSNGTGGGNAGLVYVDQWDIGFHPEDESTIYIFNDGGVQKSTNGGIWWERKNNNLVTAQLYRSASARTEPTFMVGGFQDHGLQRVLNTDESLLWKRMTTFDGAVCIIDPTNSNILYMNWNAGTIWKSVNKGASVFQIMNGINEGGPWIPPLVMDPQNTNVLYTAGNNNIYKTSNGGAFWGTIANIPAVNTIAIDAVNNNYVYAHAYTPQGTWALWRSSDAGSNWEQIPDNSTTNIPTWRVTDLEVDPNQSGVLYATRNSVFPNNDHVKKSTDFGQTWVDITNNLPDIPTNAIAVSPFNGDHLYLATDLGVYLSTNAGNSWQEFNDNLPLVYAFDIHIQPGDSTARIATSGRGVWKTKLAGIATGITDTNPELIADFGLESNYPNPFNPSTTIPYRLGKNSFISATIYNELGQAVKEIYSGYQTAGKHTLQWDGTNTYEQPVASGVYFLRMVSGGIAKTVKLTLLR